MLVGSGSGAGLFGHSFLKVGQEAIDFTVENAKYEGAWLIRELGGANKARLHIAPYKTREYAYTHKEARNIYLIDLNLSLEQEERLMLAALSRAKTPKPYGFFRANCAGEIADLLTSVGVGVRQNYLYTAPQDLLCALEGLEQGAAQKIQAKKNVFYEQRARLSSDDKHCVDLALNNQEACLDAVQKKRESTRAALAFLDATGGDLALRVRLIKRAITFEDENKSVRASYLRAFRRLGVGSAREGARVRFAPYYSLQREQNSLQKIELFSLLVREKDGFESLEIFRVLNENGFDLYFKDTSSQYALGIEHSGGKFYSYLDLSQGLLFKQFAVEPFLWLGFKVVANGEFNALFYAKAGVQGSFGRLDLKAFKEEFLPKGFGALGSSQKHSANILHARLEVLPHVFFELSLTKSHRHDTRDDLNLALNLLF